MDKPPRPVRTDLPDPLPIGEAELALLESYFSAAVVALADDRPVADTALPETEPV